MTSPAAKHARLVSSAMSAMHRYASVYEVVYEVDGRRVKRAPEVARSCSKLLGPITSDDERVTRVFQ